MIPSIKPQAGFKIWDLNPPENSIRHIIEHFYIEVAHPGADHAKDGVRQKLHRGEIHRPREEQGAPPEILVKNGRSHNGGDDAG
jgi:hypothetical protein